MQQEFETEVLLPAGRPSRRKVAGATLALALVATVATFAGGVSSAGAARTPSVPSALAQAAAAQPDVMFSVIVQGDSSERSDKLVKRVGGRLARTMGLRGSDRKQYFEGLRDQFDAINGISLTLSGRDLQKLFKESGITAITVDAPVQLAANGNSQKWVSTVGAKWYWSSRYYSSLDGTAPAIAIAIVDSGIAAKNGDVFGDRVVASVDLATSQPNTPNGDGYGHGTMVAGLAAGGSLSRSGVHPGAKLVSIDVVDDIGRANTSDVIRACDWILANKAAYNIRVANFSLGAEGESSFRWDPLDKAVEKLWFSGVTVVTSAGNYRTTPGASGVHLAPANDPFVITVGATDDNGTARASDDFAAPWSAYGYTNDGFAKPDLSAPGRYMIAPIPASSKLGDGGGQDKTLVQSGYLELSGTSFSAPIVAGAAAALLTAHPGWTPDQVKGALMRGATRVASNTDRQLGVGEVSILWAIMQSSPPNPNAALNQYAGADPAGGSVPVFDEASWASAAAANASWASASWASASWASASWASASWASASWASASWASASWSSASWANASWATASWANSAAGDPTTPYVADAATVDDAVATDLNGNPLTTGDVIVPLA